jgi:cytochrome c oxidase subunit I
MSSESIALSGTVVARHPLLDKVYGWITTVDHKRLGILYILFALIFLAIGGIEVTIMRLQLIRPPNDFVSSELFNRLFTMHGTTMIFFVAMPLVFGFANYMVALMIGARDMAFPRLNAFSFWMTAFGALILYSSFCGGTGFLDGGNAPDVGWFAYAPGTAPRSASPESGCHDPRPCRLNLPGGSFAAQFHHSLFRRTAGPG